MAELPEPPTPTSTDTINGLLKAELIHRDGSWRCLEAIEYVTLEWVDWFNNRQLLDPIGFLPPFCGRDPTLEII